MSKLAVSAYNTNLVRGFMWSILSYMALGYALLTGFATKLWLFDFTGIGFGLIVAYIICTVAMNLLEYDDYNFMWYISNKMTTIGMIGTVIGFIVAMQGWWSLDFSNTAALQSALADIGAGVSVALYTTLVGLITQFLLQTNIQLLVMGKEAI